MAEKPKRMTIYLEPELYHAVQEKSAHSNRSTSDIVNEALRLSVREDGADLKAFETRAAESVISKETLLKMLGADGEK